MAEVVYQHHERMYGEGLKEMTPPSEARIMTVANVLDALASHPPEVALGTEAELDEISRKQRRFARLSGFR